MEAERILDGLNPAQKAAVTNPAPVLQVLAPPGSGKTKTLTARAAYLIAHEGLNPRNILICTFTNKASKEMGERICNFLGKDLASKLILGTFHSISRRFLSAYGKMIGLDEKFGIADSSDTTNIITRLVKKLNLTANPAQARSRISSLKSQNISSEQYAVKHKKVKEQEFGILYREYEDHLRISNLLDFDDLLMRCAELLRRHPGCVANIEAVLIDEFQDTNHVQYELMELFASKRKTITIVGDPDQSIYGWRNAEIKNLIKMRDQFQDTHVINLEYNYRSSVAILLAAQEVIEQDETRPPKMLRSTLGIGTQPVLRKLPSASNEASWIVSEIRRTSALSGGLLGYSDYAVLLRSAALSRLVEAALVKEGIPYRMVGGTRFYERLEVRLAIDYLRVLSHPSNSDAIARVINVPARGVGDKTVQALLEEAESERIPLWKVIKDAAQGRKRPKIEVSSQAQKGIDLFANLILTCQKKLQEPLSEDVSLADFLGCIVQKIGLEAFLKKKYPEEFDTRWANVSELIAQASEFLIDQSDAVGLVGDIGPNSQDAQGLAEQPPASMADALEQFLGHVALATEPEKKEDGEREALVTISTIHRAKGLEWPVVFIPAAYGGSIPHSRAEDNDEERRLLYVAMTRAQALLYMSCPTKNSQHEKTTMSPFLDKESLARYITNAGPVFGFEVAKELSTILKRPCPEVEAVEDALKEVDFAKDNQWPLSGKYTDDEHQEWTKSANINPLHDVETRKRRKLSGKANEGERKIPMAGFASTMQNSGHYAIATSTLSNAFISGASLKSLQPREESRGQMQSKPSSVTASVPAKRKGATQSGQESLMSFFTKSHVKPTVSFAHSKVIEADTAAATSFRLPPLRDISEIANHPSLTPLTKASQSLSAMKDTEGPTKAEKYTRFKPAATFHTTSVTQVGSGTPQRKTLGVRRSMNGWAERMQK